MSENKIDGNLNEVLRLNIKDMKADNTFKIDNDKINISKILVRESEFIRILKCFNPGNKLTDGTGYPFVRDMIVLKIGKSYNKYEKQLCTDINAKINELKKSGLKDVTKQIEELENKKGVINVQFIKTIKETDNNSKKESVTKIMQFKRILCGSSAIRQTKEFYVNIELYDAVMEVLLTGVPKDSLHPSDKFSKYSSYLALVATDSKKVSMPDICVVDDFEWEVEDTFDIVKQVVTDGKIKYDVNNNVKSKEKILPFDGAGLVSYEVAEKWSKELNLDYVPASFQIRVLNGIKGNLYTFPLSEFKEKYPDVTSKEDVWNNPIDITSKTVFLTKSMFKFKDKYSSFDNWYKSFNTPVAFGENKYSRTFNISACAETQDELTEELVTAYQPLHTLEFSDEDIKILCEPTVKRIKDVHSDITEFIKYRGLSDLYDEEDDTCEVSSNLPPYYKALALDNTLQYDPYIRRKIKEDLKSLKQRAYIGKLFMQGCYQTATPDIYGLAQYIFGLKVTGALKKDEVYCVYWNKRNKDKISIWRNPHIACEWYNVNVVSNKDTAEWFKYQNSGIVTDMYSTLPLRLGTMDFDGDHIASVSSDIIYKAVKNAKANTIKFVTEIDEKEEKSKAMLPINNIDKLIHTNTLGFQNNIGECTNKVTVLWSIKPKNQAEKELIHNNIKILSVVNQLIIDFVKTGEKVPIPEDIIKMVSKHKQPFFMRYKNKNAVGDNTIQSMGETFAGITEEVIKNAKKYAWSKGTMDKICKYLMDEVEKIELAFDEIGDKKSYYAKALTDIEYIYNATYPRIKDVLIKLQSEHDAISNRKYRDEKSYCQCKENALVYKRFYDYCKNTLLLICPDTNKLINYVIYAYFADSNLVNLNRAIMWNAFGDEMVARYMKQPLLNIEDINELQKRYEKALDKVNKLKDNADKVSLKNISNDSNIIIYKSDIKQLRKLLKGDPESQRLMFVLLILYRKILEDNNIKTKAITLNKGVKGQITKNQLCKMADIYNNQINKRLNILKEKELIYVDVADVDNKKSNLKAPKITVLFNEIQDDIKCEIKDINDCRKVALEYFKK